MADAAFSPPQAAAGDEGFFEHARGLLAALAEYLSARLRLAGGESRDALVHYGLILGLAVAALAVAVLGYIFFCLGLAMLLAHLLHIHAGWTILIFAVLHFGAALGCLLLVKTRLPAPMFSATLAEFKKDQQWMSTPKTN